MGVPLPHPHPRRGPGRNVRDGDCAHRPGGQLTRPAGADRDAYDELAAYTLIHGDPAFIHQHVVDAFGAQHATEGSKPIGVAFALIGLGLHLERGWTGREVQLAHMRLARSRRSWPTFPLPDDRGDTTIHDVLGTEPGPARDDAIEAWCASVWRAWSGSHERVRELLRETDE